MKQKKISKSAIGLMGTLLINNILYMFLNTFMIAYFIKLTNYNYKLVSIYYILSFIGILLIFLSFGRIVKNKNKLGIFRSGIFLYCIYILMIALLKEKITIYFAPLGFFYGLVQGLFWVAAHNLISDHASNDTNKFISFKSIFSKLLKILFPIIFGASIELTSFAHVSKIIIFLSIVQFIFSLFIEKEENNYRKYSLIEYLSYIKSNDKFKNVYKISACDGIVNYFLETLIVILIVITFKTTLSLGIITTISSICSMISVYIFQYRLKSSWKILFISNVIMIISLLVLLIDVNKITIIIYNLSASIFLVLLRNTGDTKRYEIVASDKNVLEHYTVEHQVICESVLNISRIIGYSLLFIVSIFNNIFLFKILLILVTIIILFYSQLLIKLKKEEVDR